MGDERFDLGQIRHHNSMIDGVDGVDGVDGAVALSWAVGQR
ncbi:hypothetical protein AB0C15_13505 [Micromonospora sp. NPDC048835]